MTPTPEQRVGDLLLAAELVAWRSVIVSRQIHGGELLHALVAIHDGGDEAPATMWQLGQYAHDLPGDWTTAAIVKAIDAAIDGLRSGKLSHFASVW